MADPGQAHPGAGVMEDTSPVQWVGTQALVTLPARVDVSNAGQIGEELLSVISRGAAVLVVEMTATAACDHAGADAVARAYQQAAVHGTQLRLVVTAPAVRRVLGFSGLEGLVPVYPSRAAAGVSAADAEAPAGRQQAGDFLLVGGEGFHRRQGLLAQGLGPLDELVRVGQPGRKAPFAFR